MTPPQEVLSRRELFRSIVERTGQGAAVAAILAACTPAAPPATVADQRASTLPSAPPAPDFKNFDAQIASMTKGGFIDMLKTPKPSRGGVSADLLKFDYDEKQGIIIARWRVENWRIFKDVEIKDIKTENLINTSLTPADQANGVSVQGRADLKWVWRQAALKGDLNNPQRGTWGNYRNGAETFSCQLGKQVSCDLGPYRIFRGDNWPVLGDLFEMVYSDPTS